MQIVLFHGLEYLKAQYGGSREVAGFNDCCFRYAPEILVDLTICEWLTVVFLKVFFKLGCL